jgi:hypothetical protein
MSDYLTNLAERAVGIGMLTPRLLPPRFADAEASLTAVADEATSGPPPRRAADPTSAAATTCDRAAAAPDRPINREHLDTASRRPTAYPGVATPAPVVGGTRAPGGAPAAAVEVGGESAGWSVGEGRSGAIKPASHPFESPVSTDPTAPRPPVGQSGEATGHLPDVLSARTPSSHTSIDPGPTRQRSSDPSVAARNVDEGMAADKPAPAGSRPASRPFPTVAGDRPPAGAPAMPASDPAPSNDLRVAAKPAPRPNLSPTVERNSVIVEDHDAGVPAPQSAAHADLWETSAEPAPSATAAHEAIPLAVPHRPRPRHADTPPPLRTDLSRADHEAVADWSQEDVFGGHVPSIAVPSSKKPPAADERLDALPPPPPAAAPGPLQWRTPPSRRAKAPDVTAPADVPAISVTIGRLEVRGAPSVSTARPQGRKGAASSSTNTKPAPLGLSTYLRRRAKGGDT